MGEKGTLPQLSTFILKAFSHAGVSSLVCFNKTGQCKLFPPTLPSFEADFPPLLPSHSPRRRYLSLSLMSSSTWTFPISSLYCADLLFKCCPLSVISSNHPCSYQVHFLWLSLSVFLTSWLYWCPLPFLSTLPFIMYVIYHLNLAVWPEEDSFITFKTSTINLFLESWLHCSNECTI